MLSAVLVAATMGLNAQKPISAPAGGKAISDELIGILPPLAVRLSATN